MKISEVVNRLVNMQSQFGDLDVLCGEHTGSWGPRHRSRGIVDRVANIEVDIRELTDPLHAMDEDTMRVILISHSKG